MEIEKYNEYMNGRKEMDYKEMYQQWLDNPYFDEDTKAELKAI